MEIYLVNLAGKSCGFWFRETSHTHNHYASIVDFLPVNCDITFPLSPLYPIFSRSYTDIILNFMTKLCVLGLVDSFKMPAPWIIRITDHSFHQKPIHLTNNPTASILNNSHWLQINLKPTDRLWLIQFFFFFADILSAVSTGEVDLNDPSRSGNYTVTFVPLISVIANYLPVFLKRLRTQEIISARSNHNFANYPP